MVRPLFVFAAAFLACSCADVRIGLTSVRVNDSGSLDTIVKVVKIALDPQEKNCSVELNSPGSPIQSKSGEIRQVAVVTVCGHVQKYRIWRFLSDVPGWVDVEAQRI